MPDSEVQRLRALSRAYSIRFTLAVLLGFLTFQVFSLPGESLYFTAARFAAVVLFVLLWIYALVAWFLLVGTQLKLRRARRAA